MRRLFKVLLIGVVFILNGVFSPIFASETEEALHTELVTTAIQYDVFNQRCRGVSAANNESKVNRLLIEKYGMTLNNYIKVYLSQDPRQAKETIQQFMLKKIAKTKACQPSQRGKVHKQFKTKFRTRFHQVEISSWFPEVSRAR